MTAGRTWKLWAHRYESGLFMNPGEKSSVEFLHLPEPIVPVLAEEILGDPYAPEVTHYGWQEARAANEDSPTLIQIRAGLHPTNARSLLSMCFPYGLEKAVEAARGAVIALRITERVERAP